MGMSNEQENEYTDQENTWTSQIAYCNITKALIDDIKDDINISDEEDLSEISKNVL